MHYVIKYVSLGFLLIFTAGCQYAGWHNRGATIGDFRADWKTATKQATERTDRKQAREMANARQKDFYLGSSPNRFDNSNLIAAGFVGAIARPAWIDTYRPQFLHGMGWRQITVKKQTELQVTVFKMTPEGAIEVPPPTP